jgi:hypothetical protein
MKNAFWIGPIVKSENLNKYNVISPAANIWQFNFLVALVNNNYSITCLSYIPEQSWPKGKLWVPSCNDKFDQFDVLYTSYLNIKYIRDYWITFSLFFKVFFSASISPSSITFSYNSEYKNRLLIKLLKYFQKTEYWISIVADHLSEGKPDAIVFLSFGYFTKYNFKNKYFFDGGIISKLPFSNKVRSKGRHRLLFAGSITIWTGIVDFVIKYNNILNKLGIELHIYGNGKSEELIDISNSCSNLFLHGFVSDDELRYACLNASAFINPRPINVKYGENNFPSKLLYYIPYCKPILSTLTEGLAPKYSNVIYEYNEHNFDVILKKLVDNNFVEDTAKYKSFMEENTWEKGVSNLLNNFNSQIKNSLL